MFKASVMMDKFFFCLFFAFSIGANAQDSNQFAFHSDFEANVFLSQDNQFAKQLMADPRTTEHELLTFTTVLNDYSNKLADKREKYRSEKDFVSAIFYKTHRKFLKRYKEFTPFAEMLRSGVYDCLSATTLYSMLFDNLNIRYEIVETNYHIYLNVLLGESNILIESTDPLYGFVSDAEEIEERLNTFASNNSSATKARSYSFKARVNEKISFDELIGLHYYNASVKAYNEHELISAVELFKKALLFRNNPRANEFGLLLVQTILVDDHMADQVKSAYIDQLKELLIMDNILARN